MMQYKEVAVLKFFEKNKHLLGFDNPTKRIDDSCKGDFCKAIV